MIFNKEDIQELISFYAKQYGLDYCLIEAIIIIESNYNTYANRYEPNWRWLLNPKYWSKRLQITDKTEFMNQCTSWGTMQVMGSVARELGFKDHLPALCYPPNGIDYGCRKLKQLYIKYSGSIDDVIAAYNAGSPRCNRNGQYYNQNYVDKVRLEMKRLKELGIC